MVGFASFIPVIHASLAAEQNTPASHIPPCVREDGYQSFGLGEYNSYCAKACDPTTSPDDHTDCRASDQQCKGFCQWNGYCTADLNCCSNDSDCEAMLGSSDDWESYCDKRPGNTSACSWIDMQKCSSHQFADDLCQSACTSRQCTTPLCLPMSGQWIQVSTSSGKQTLSLEHGVTKSYVADSLMWGAAATASVGKSFAAIGSDSEIQVSGAVSKSFALSYRSTFTMEKATSFEYIFDEPGVVWQWQWKAYGPCGVATVTGHDVVLTAGAWASPCCLPGWSQDISNPTGACHATPDGDMYSLCSGVPTTTSSTTVRRTTTAAPWVVFG